MSEIKVTFETITPLWTGDAWGESNIIRPSSIIGSLRFWFEVICYFAGITTDNDYEDGKLKCNIENKNFRQEFLKLKNQEPNKDEDELADIALSNLGVPLPARIFGCTGWKGKIGIKKIINVSERNNYGYYQGKLEIKELEYTKKYQNGRTKKVTPTWYFSKGFVEEFTIIFEIKNNKTKDTIFYPLLNFIKNYGFLGGKWNIGYGRVKVSNIEYNGRKLNSLDDCNKFIFSKFNKYNNSYYPDKSFNDIVIVKDIEDFEQLNDKNNFKKLIKNKNKKILILKEKINNKDLKEMIKELIRLKATCRRDISDYSERHAIFGIGGKNAQGTKILPWIYEDNGGLKGGFVSIAGMLNLGG